MEKKKEDRAEKRTVGKAANLMVGKAKNAVVKVVDRNNDGALNMEDARVVAGAVGEAAKKAAVSVKNTAVKSGNQLSDRIEQAKRDKAWKMLMPIFIEDLDRTDFLLPKLVRIVEMDKKHSESDICVDSIGHESYPNKVRIINIYPEFADDYGLIFTPDKESGMYYVDPVDRNHYIALSEYFNYLKIARVNELQKIAQDLGAKHFKVTYKEHVREASIAKAGGNIKGKHGPNATKKEIDVNVEHFAESSSLSTIEISAEMHCMGNSPIEPKLVYFQKDPSIQNLIALRMSNNPISHQVFLLELGDTTGIKEKDAAKIDAVLSALKMNGKYTMESAVKREAKRCFEYEIDF